MQKKSSKGGSKKSSKRSMTGRKAVKRSGRRSKAGMKMKGMNKGKTGMMGKANVESVI